MRINTELLGKIAGNKLILYIFSRYGVYFIQFINSIFIAIYLGPYYLGVWGFISLIISYLNQFDFGISHSVNAIISINKSKDVYLKEIIGTSLTMLFGLSLLVILFFILNYIFEFDIGSKFDFDLYAPMVCLIGVFGYFNSLLSKIFRVFGRVMEMAFNQSVFPVLMLLVIFIFKGKELLWALLIANLISYALSLFLFLIRTPVKLKFSFNKELWRMIQVRGWHLFIYNTSFYLIIISTRTFISAFYEVEEFGYFTFAFALANAFLLFLDSISSLVYPKMLNRMANATMEKAANIIELMRNSYITMAHFLIHLAIAVMPIFFLFLPQYSKSGEVFHLVALTIAVECNSYGYAGLLIAKGKEKRIGLLSFITLILNVVIVFLLIKVIMVKFIFVILGTMLSYIFYVFMVGRIGRKQMAMKTSLSNIIVDVFPAKLAFPFLLSLLLSFFNVKEFALLLPLLLFLTLNFKTIKNLKSVARNIIMDSKIIDI